MLVSQKVLYRDLPLLGEDPRSSCSWSLFGEHDELGALNRLSHEAVQKASASIQRGEIFPLNWAVELPDPPLFGRRRVVRTAVIGGGYADDRLDDFHLQGSTQWDTLAHVCTAHGFYNSHPHGEDGLLLDDRNGAHVWATRGIAGRFVLADIARWRESHGRPIHVAGAETVPLSDLIATLDAQETVLEEGDVLLIRFGWVGWYERASQAEREALANLPAPNSPGLTAEPGMAEWLWDSGISAVAADNPAVEAIPTPEGPYGCLHFSVLGLLGIPFGELFVLDALAEDCARDGIYTGLFTSAPLNVRGGVGSPANALCIK